MQPRMSLRDFRSQQCADTAFISAFFEILHVKSHLPPFIYAELVCLCFLRVVHHSICFCAAILQRKCAYLSFLVIKVSHHQVCICPFGTVVVLMLLRQSATSAHDLCFPSPTWCWLQFSLWPAPLPRWPSQNQHGASLHKISSAEMERAREINTMWAINISTIVFDSECSRGSSEGMCGVAAYLL